jgi:hypothetical protein
MEGIKIVPPPIPKSPLTRPVAIPMAMRRDSLVCFILYLVVLGVHPVLFYTYNLLSLRKIWYIITSELLGYI